MSRRSAPALLVLLILLPLSPVHADVGGEFSLDAGRIDHPLGIREEAASTFGVGGLRLDGTTRLGTSLWRLGLEFQEVRFDERAELDSSHLAVGLEWFHEATGLSSGVQIARRTQEPAYAPYDHDEVFAYLAFKIYPAPSLMLRGHVGLRRRSYDALPEESFIEPFVQFESKKFWENRTTLGLAARLGGKLYHEPEAHSVWGSTETPTTSQISLAATLARGLSERIGLRAVLRGAATLSDFPYYVDTDLYDSPLLDRYASAGTGATAAVKVLGPGRVWYELGFDADRRDYGAIRFADGDGGTGRVDTIRSLGLSLKRSFGAATLLTAAASRIDQSSNVTNYDWSGTTWSAGLSRAW